MDGNEFQMYNEDKSSLVPKFFSRVESLEGQEGNDESEEEKLIIGDLLQNKIDPQTLRQGEF